MFFERNMISPVNVDVEKKVADILNLINEQLESKNKTCDMI